MVIDLPFLMSPGTSPKPLLQQTNPAWDYAVYRD